MAEVSYNYSYTPTVDHRESNLYIEEYYSGTDTKIYFDNDEQTEIGFIQYEIQEQLKPLYGYNSRTFDDVIIGNRIVTGTFSVPIKNKGKQEFTVEQLSTYMNDGLSSNIQSYNLNEEDNLYNTDWFGSTKRNIENHKNENIDANYLTKMIAIGLDINTNASFIAYQKAIKEFQKANNLSVTGQLNDITKNKIDEIFAEQSATPITLDGGTGYSNFEQTKGKTKLSGNGLLLDSIATTSGTVYQVLDSKGNIYYMKGLII